jgi:hypothetical protein
MVTTTYETIIECLVEKLRTESYWRKEAETELREVKAELASLIEKLKNEDTETN